MSKKKQIQKKEEFGKINQTINFIQVCRYKYLIFVEWFCRDVYIRVLFVYIWDGQSSFVINKATILNLTNQTYVANVEYYSLLIA